MNAKINNKPGFLYIEGFGQISITEEIVVKFAVASHPQGKPEGFWIDEVMKVL